MTDGCGHGQMERRRGVHTAAMAAKLGVDRVK
jgi:hypothetical protein